jgi:chemotaxis protein CheC
VLAAREIPDIDLLREVASIGFGRAVTALGTFAKRTGEMAVPVARLANGSADLADLLDPLGGEVVAVGVALEGLLGGHLVLALPDGDARTLAALLRQPVPPSGWNAVSDSAILEAGNIAGSSFVSAVGRLTGRTLLLSVPQPARGTGRECFDALARELALRVALATRFSLRPNAGECARVDGVLVAVPDPSRIPDILAAVPGH